MLLYPKNVKFKKPHSYIPQSNEWEFKLQSLMLQKGEFGIKVIKSGHISAAQLEACRRIIIRTVRKVALAKVWIMVFPFVSVTSKPEHVRMGKGKGAHKEWVTAVKKGKIIFEVAGLSERVARNVLNHVLSKLSLKAIIIRND